jgi:acetyl esterase/lipase
VLGRRDLIIGAGLVGAGAVLAGCGLFGDRGPDRIRYGPAPSQFGELYEPDAPTPWPIVVAVHGGAWRNTETLSILDDACADLRDGGAAVWNVEYRRVGEPGGGYPGTFADVGAAVDHLAVLARDRPLDLDRVVVLGHSAGGTLALWAAGRATLPAGTPGAGPRVDPVAALCLAGVTDLVACAREGRVDGACSQLLGGLPSERPERYALTSPIERVPLGLPQVVVHGREDIVVPVEQSERYGAAAERSGDPVTLELIDGANHFSLIETDQPAWSLVVDAIDRLAL